MPVYNGHRYLARALQSVVDQHSKDVEVIVVDDGSTDDSVTIARGFTHALPLTIVTQEPTGNWLCGTNRALREARGTFISVLHQDDAWLPTRISELKALASAHPNVGMIAHAVHYVDDDDRPVGVLNAPLNNGVLADDALLPKLLVQNFFAMPAPLVRRSIAMDVGGFDESLWYTADWDLWLKVGAIAPVAYSDHKLASFRLHQESQTATRSSNSAAFREQLHRCYERHAAVLARRGLLDSRTQKTAQLSIDVNVALAARAHGQTVPWTAVLASAFSAGLTGCVHYVRMSRIAERLWSRLRLRRARRS